MGAEVVFGDITDVSSMRESMQGSDVVFHLAGWYEIGAVDREQMEITNVGGTRKVLRLAHELGVPRIIYTSTVNVFGDTKGEFVDETYFNDGPFLTEYDRTKWLAHYKVAVPLMEKGAPITIVMPGPVYGPGDQSIIADVMRMFYRGFPIIPGPDTVLTFTHVEDVAEGHLLALEKGRIGETYILTGPAIPLGEMIDFWAHLTGQDLRRRFVCRHLWCVPLRLWPIWPAHLPIWAQSSAKKALHLLAQPIWHVQIRRAKSWAGRHGRCNWACWRRSNG